MRDFLVLHEGVDKVRSGNVCSLIMGFKIGVESKSDILQMILTTITTVAFGALKTVDNFSNYIKLFYTVDSNSDHKNGWQWRSLNCSHFYQSIFDPGI